MISTAFSTSNHQDVDVLRREILCKHIPNGSKLEHRRGLLYVHMGLVFELSILGGNA